MRSLADRLLVVSLPALSLGRRFGRRADSFAGRLRLGLALGLDALAPRSPRGLNPARAESVSLDFVPCVYAGIDDALVLPAN